MSLPQWADGTFRQKIFWFREAIAGMAIRSQDWRSPGTMKMQS